MRRLALLLVLASCGPPQFIRYDLDTEVAKDGSWSRTYTARGYRKSGAAPHAAEYKPVSDVHCAALPPCPPKRGEEPPEPLPACAPEEVWALRHEMVDDKCGAALRRETFHRTGTANTDIAADFRVEKTIGGTERIAGNRVTVTRHDLGVLMFHEYRESFKQWITPADVIEAGRITLDLLLDFGLVAMHEELGADYDVTKLEAFIREARAELGEIVTLLAFTDLDRDAAGDEIFRRVRQRGYPSDAKGRPDDDRFGEWFDAHISPMLAPKREDAPLLTWADVDTEYYKGYLEKKWEKRVEALTTQDGPLMKQLDTIDGAFASVDFRVRVKLAGQLLDTNGAVGADGAVSWELSPDDFEVEPKEIHATSVDISPRFAKLYPKADADGSGLLAIAGFAAKLSTEDRARVATLLAKKDIDGLTDWCQTIAWGQKLVRRLGLAIECHEPPSKTPPQW